MWLDPIYQQTERNAIKRFLAKTEPMRLKGVNVA